MKVATNAMCHPQTKKPKVKKLKLLFEKASLIASIAVWLLSFVLSDEIFGVVTKNATISPAPIKKINTNIVVSQPNSTKEYWVNIGDIKYPKDPTAVTILVATVLFDNGKCFATIETGMLIAVEPSPTPIKIPILSVK